MSYNFGGFENTDEFPWIMSPTTPSGNLMNGYRCDMNCDGIRTPPICRTPPIPRASLADATASLQSAFCKRPPPKNNSDASASQTQQVKAEIFDTDYPMGMNNNPYPYAQTFLPGQNMEITGEAAEGADAQQMDIYRDLILRHLIQDISTTCARLGLPTDPNHWCNEHCWKWIREMCEQFNVPMPKPIHLCGSALLHMGQKEFEHFAPNGGDTLYAQLQLWKTAFEAYQQHQPPGSCGGGGSYGMTAANNAGPKDWPSSSKIPRPQQPSLPRDQFQLFPSMESMNAFYNSSPFQSPTMQDQLQGVFFGNGPLLSPSNSGMSSPGSDHDLDEEDLPMGLFNMAQGNGPPYTGLPENNQGGPFRSAGTVHLWHFIRELLDQPTQYSHCVRWVNRDEGTFKIESSHALARIWGQRKNRSQMNYDKLSRSLRQYYKKGIIQKPEKKQRLVYKFLPPYNL